MGRTKVKFFTKTELKILVFNKVKQGLSYGEATKEVERDIKKVSQVYKKKLEKELKVKKKLKI